MSPRDDIGALRDRIEAGDWRALAEPDADGLLTMMLLAMPDPTWWRATWSACLAELIRPWWRGTKAMRSGRRVHEQTEQATFSAEQLTEDQSEEARRQRWKVSLAPAYWFDIACKAQLRRPSEAQVTALVILGRWLP